MSYLVVMAIALTVLLLLGVPIGLALTLGAAIGVVWIGNISMVIIAQQFFAGIDSFLLLAIPFSCWRAN